MSEVQIEWNAQLKPEDQEKVEEAKKLLEQIDGVKSVITVGEHRPIKRTVPKYIR